MLDNPDGWLALAGIVASNLLTGVGGWWAARATARGQAASARAAAEAQAEVARGPHWEAFTEKMEAHFEKRLSQQDERIAEQDSRIAEQDEKIGELGNLVERLRESVAAFKARYHAALRHIFDWRDLHPESIDRLDVPEEIVGDVLA